MTDVDGFRTETELMYGKLFVISFSTVARLTEYEFCPVLMPEASTIRQSSYIESPDTFTCLTLKNTANSTTASAMQKPESSAIYIAVFRPRRRRDLPTARSNALRESSSISAVFSASVSRFSFCSSDKLSSPLGSSSAFAAVLPCCRSIRLHAYSCNYNTYFRFYQ